jgi:gentisate 1,2-dioxygenase
MRPLRRAPSRRTSPVLVYPWERAEAALRAFAGTEADPHDDFVLEYQSPTTGRPRVAYARGWRCSGCGPACIAKPTGIRAVLYYVVRGEGDRGFVTIGRLAISSPYRRS